MFAGLLLLVHSTATGQSLPTLQITNQHGRAVITAKPYSVFASGYSLQMTTSLSLPVVWLDVTNIQVDGSASVPMVYPYMFFRLVPVPPIFQFAIFYNLDLEMNPGATMFINAPVFSNGGLWSGSTVLTFSNTVSAVGLVTNTVGDPFCAGYNGSGKSTYADGPPVPGAPPLDFGFYGSFTNSIGVRNLFNLPPPTYAMGTPAAYSPVGLTYFANEVDLYLTNYPNGTNWGALVPRGTNMTLYYQDPANGPGNYLTQVPYDFYLVTNRGTHTIMATNVVIFIYKEVPNSISNIWYAGYSFLTNDVFVDWREGWNNGSGPPKTVQAVQLDLRLFNLWLTNTGPNGGSVFNNQCLLPSHKAHPIDSIFIYNSVPLTGTTLPAVRIINGGMLPSQAGFHGFTLATPMPLYIYGDYNASNSFGSSLGQNSTTYTWPAALMADSITILSGNWNDAVTTKKPAAINTTVNAAIIAGIVPSTNGIYSGGVENFLRALESWTSSTLWYNGSIVAMYPSAYATNHWQLAGNYYNAPVRRWAYDTNFNSYMGLPPLTPLVLNHVTP